MRIALDFDETFTKDPPLWLAFIELAEHQAHYVAIVTIRDEHHDGINWSAVNLINGAPCPVIWCDGHPKKEFCEAMGEKFDVWIDDNPHSIVHGSSMHDPNKLKAWRLTDKYRGSVLPPSGHSKWYIKQGIHFDAK
jgi:hypothetical protein